MSEIGTTMDAEVIAWLMEGDPAIRWQVLRDLVDAPGEEWQAEQAKVATKGWGARLLAHRDDDGRWTPRIYGRKWISTTYSMVLLRRLGLPRDDPRAEQSSQLLLDEGLWPDGGINPSVGLDRSETCVTGFVLALLCWFSVADPRREQLVEYLLTEQMPDGGWNCERHRDATHSSFHTTTNVLEGLREYEDTEGPHHTDVLAAEARAREFLCAHRLYRSHRTAEIVDARMTRLSFPPRWRHDVLRALDYFRSANAARDSRLADAVALVESKRRGDGRWPLQQRHPGATWFEMETIGEASRWNTLRALRVLRWWHGAPPPSPPSGG